VGAVATAANSIVDADINFTLTGGTGADSITVGGGDDTIDFTSDAAADTFFFADANGSDSIINFDDDEDFLSFANITADGTIAELAVANDAGTTLATTTISSANTIVYVIDTDATELGTNIAAVISDFTSMSVVATFLNSADGVVTSDTANKTDFFIINDGSVATAAYVYVLEDNNDGITTVQAAELTLIGTITTDAAIDTGDTLIA